MRILTCLLFIAWAVALGGCVSHGTGGDPVTSKPDTGFSFSHVERYQVDSFIREAVDLQALGQTAALEKLQAMARGETADQVFILCRMLFTNRPGSDFRGPGLGQADFPDATFKSDWPLEPIALVDGVPFLLVQGYTVNGVSESGAEYLDYCEAHCVWSDYKYTVKTKHEEQTALSTLLASPKWGGPPHFGRGFLADQIN